jgi:signal transduction histidine kinase
MIAPLWLEALQRLADQAAHAIRNPLNGLALNLEVVRSRATRSGSDVTSVALFAESAADELRRATELVEALLSLARPVRKPVDLWVVMQPLLVVRHAIAAQDDGAVTVERPPQADLMVPADGDATRLAFATALEAALAGSGRVCCEVEQSATAVAVMVHGSEPPAPVPDPVRAALADHGIELERSGHSITLRFAPSGHGAGNAR